MESERLNGKTTIVTGETRGIGFGITSRYAGEEAKVVTADVLEGEDGRAAINIGPMTRFCQINPRGRGQIFVMMDYVYGSCRHIDILISCANVACPCPTLRLAREILDEVTGVGMEAPLFCCQTVGTYMGQDERGSIVNISFRNTRVINVGRIPYDITGGATNLLIEQLGARWALYNIKVNAIAPGRIQTEVVEEPPKSRILDEGTILSASPVGRSGRIEGVASLTYFLAYRDLDCIIGQVVFADGGWPLGVMSHALDYVRENEED